MKKVTGYSLLTVLVLLFNHLTSAAQCSQSNTVYSCSAVSSVGGSPSSSSNQWVSSSTGYNVTVYMEVYDDNDPNLTATSYASLWTNSYYWENSLTNEGNFAANFSASAVQNGTIGLYTYAFSGEAQISAVW